MNATTFFQNGTFILIHGEVQEDPTGREANILVLGFQQSDHELVYWEGREQTQTSERPQSRRRASQLELVLQVRWGLGLRDGVGVREWENEACLAGLVSVVNPFLLSYLIPIVDPVTPATFRADSCFPTASGSFSATTDPPAAPSPGR